MLQQAVGDQEFLATLAMSSPSITTLPMSAVTSSDGEPGAHPIEPLRTSSSSLSERITGVRFSASWRCWSSTSGTNPFASMLGSVENSSPICTSSL